MEREPRKRAEVSGERLAHLAHFGHAIEKADSDLAAMEAQLADFASKLESARADHEDLMQKHELMLAKYTEENDPEGKLSRQLADTLSTAGDMSRERLKSAESMHLTAALMTEDFRKAHEQLKNMRRMFLEEINKE